MIRILDVSLNNDSSYWILGGTDFLLFNQSYHTIWLVPKISNNKSPEYKEVSCNFWFDD